eukprot:625752-Pyramimonas_sp.AAC.1
MRLPRRVGRKGARGRVLCAGRQPTNTRPVIMDTLSMSPSRRSALPSCQMIGAAERSMLSQDICRRLAGA